MLGIIANTTKVVEGDIHWRPHPTALPAVEFVVNVASDEPYPLVLVGWFNSVSRKLSFSLIARGIGRVYALDLGRPHTNPDGAVVGEVHKHRWTREHHDGWAYNPSDISADWSNPVTAWQQFCAEASIRHAGTMIAPSTEEGGRQ